MNKTPTLEPNMQNILVSVCCACLPPTKKSFDQLRRVAREIGKHFRFWEIVLIVDGKNGDVFLELLEDIPNLRLFKVRQNIDLYRKRVIAASEAIGDVVLLVGADDIDKLDLVEMVSRAADGKKAVLGVHEQLGRFDGAMSRLLVALGRGAGFQVSLRDMQTIALPRTMINYILAHPSFELALRFPPLDGRVPLDYLVAHGSLSSKTNGNWGQRLTLLYKLLVNLAPRMLHLVSLSSALSVMLGICYTIYVLGAWMILPTLEPGWLTISLTLSLTAAFLGFAIFGLSLGLQHLLSRVESSDLEESSTELNRVDLFGQVARDLNVEVIEAAEKGGANENS